VSAKCPLGMRLFTSRVTHLMSTPCCRQAGRIKADAPLAGPLLLNSICTGQVCQRFTSAGHRGMVSHKAVERTQCGAASAANLEPDFYGLVTTHGMNRHHLLYSAQGDSHMAQSLRSQLGCGYGLLPNCACAEYNAVRLAACKKRDDITGNNVSPSVVRLLANAAAGAAHALFRVIRWCRSARSRSYGDTGSSVGVHTPKNEQRGTC
jgi:hypothetical protein